jgi:hypothetical protein
MFIFFLNGAFESLLRIIGGYYTKKSRAVGTVRAIWSAIPAKPPQKKLHAPAAARGDRIVAVRAEGMAAQDAPDAEKRALERTMRPERLYHVVRAARLETARAAHNRRKDDLVRAHEEN